MQGGHTSDRILSDFISCIWNQLESFSLVDLAEFAEFALDKILWSQLKKKLFQLNEMKPSVMFFIDLDTCTVPVSFS